MEFIKGKKTRQFFKNYSREERREKFFFVIQNNNWNKKDVVILAPAQDRFLPFGNAPDPTVDRQNLF
ncbi:hypothetical protein [Allocoleopsis franciscana]|nr:hypothetical protein [Allocoleopsis franciscana]